MDVSACGESNLTEEDFHAIAFAVITGELPRDEVIHQPPALALYAGITVMLAIPYKVTADNRVKGALGSALRDLILRGKAMCQLQEKVVTGGFLQKLAGDMKLCRYDTQKKGTILQPPPGLVELVERYRNHPGVDIFQKDMETGIADHERWLKELAISME